MNTLTNEQILKNRIKTVVLAYSEMLLAMSLSSSSMDSLWPYFYCTCVFSFVAIRSVFKEQLDLTCLVFLVMYFIMNIIVHLVDLCVHQSFWDT